MGSFTLRENCMAGAVELRLDTLVINKRVTSQRLRPDGGGYRGRKNVVLTGEVIHEMLAKLAQGATLEQVLPASYKASIAACAGCVGKPDHAACSLKSLSSRARRNFRNLR